MDRFAAWSRLRAARKELEEAQIAYDSITALPEELEPCLHFGISGWVCPLCGWTLVAAVALGQSSASV